MARALGPHVAVLARLADCYVSVHPSAGLPGALGEYPESPADTAAVLGRFAADGLVNIVGGCCGTTPAHIDAVAWSVAHSSPRALRKSFD